MTYPNITLDQLQARIGEGNAKRGFHAEGDALRESSLDTSALRNYYFTKAMLIVTEVAEGAEELRHGRNVDERYYSGGVAPRSGDALDEKQRLDYHANPRKPEGFPSELADVVIRCFDLAYEAGFSLGDVINEKLDFNETRSFMHDGKVV